MNGDAGLNGGNVEIGNFHGSAALAAADLAAGKFLVDATITGATADTAGKVSVDFKVLDKAGKPVKGIASVYANIAKLVPKPVPTENGPNQWVPYIYRKVTVPSTGGDWPAANNGKSADQGYRENNGTLTDHGDGTYTYVFATNISAITTPAGNTAISYDRTLTHRVSIMMGGHTGATASTTYDFIPAGGTVTETRDIVRTEACMQCHGDGFAAHGGDRTTVETCVTCHNQSGTDPYSGNTLDMKVMLHKIHAGGEVASIAGPDGIVFDNPTTPGNEAADNGSYAIWNYQHQKTSWENVGFPAIIQNCTKCHDGKGSNSGNWNAVPSVAACNSCHDNLDFTTGTNHPGGAQQDKDCPTCHKASTNGLGPSVVTAHDWTNPNRDFGGVIGARIDQRGVPEFDVALSMSAPANGVYFVPGESPVVTVVLTDVATGNPIDHSTITSESSSAAEGCLAGAACPARDNKFTSSALFVHGPRAHRMPVLTTAARAAVLSTSTGPFNISAATSLGMVFDGGYDIYQHDISAPLAASITVNVVNSFFADKTAASVGELANWLNNDAKFKVRGIAYVDEATGKLGIRSRNLGVQYAVALLASDVNTAVFGGDLTQHEPAGSTPTNQLTSTTDPKVTRNVNNITYQLDPVNDLTPGTYIVDVEIADRGRIDDNNYKTPSVKRITFQVGTDVEEKQVADNCETCHETSDGKGMIIDAPRHNKVLNHTAVDQCGNCHDYQSQSGTGDWAGAKAIARRVHAVHNGSNLLYPEITVGHADTDPGRNWDIVFPQNIRNCDKTCHSADTSGSWLQKPSRNPCYGCHDSLPAVGHMKQMTFDPTPLNPWSGDEIESCPTCHVAD